MSGTTIPFFLQKNIYVKMSDRLLLLPDIFAAASICF